ncbi:MAG: guanylate kinase [Nitrospirae bacterium]|nr:guanylate kinase [Nitrospirota bacterium]
MQKKSEGSIFIISAPSGAGKTTICRKIIMKMENVQQSVSYTTRLPRKGEVEDVDYTYIGEKAFRKMAGSGDFVEWAEVHGNLYGTSRKRLEKLMAAGFDVILDIDTQGAKQIRNSYGGGVFVFILPPSMDALRERLEKRKTRTKEDKADIERRLRRSVDEIRDYKLYDYVIVNDELSISIRKLESIITSERLRNEKIDPGWIKKNFLS